MIKLKLTKTREQESTERAQRYFADFGKKDKKKLKNEFEDNNETSSFPDYDLASKSEEDTKLKANIISQKLTVDDLINNMCISPECKDA